MTPSHHLAAISFTVAIASLCGAAGCAPPDLLLEGVGAEGGPYSTNAFVAAGQANMLEARIVNRGGQGTSSPVLTFAELFCLAIDARYSPEDLDGLGAGASHVFAIGFTPDGCTTTTIVDWFLEADGQEFRGTFNLHLDQE